jgi:hypothetical protein
MQLMQRYKIWRSNRRAVRKKKGRMTVQILSNKSMPTPGVIQEMKWLEVELAKKAIGKGIMEQ